jgi:hypothetical protein
LTFWFILFKRFLGAVFARPFFVNFTAERKTLHIVCTNFEQQIFFGPLLTASIHILHNLASDLRFCMELAEKASRGLANIGKILILGNNV